MSNKNIHRENNDVFSDLVKQKLENHRLPVDESLWDGIEQQLRTLQPEQKQRIVYWKWIASGVAVAIVAAALLVYKPQEAPLLAPSLSLQQEQQTDTGLKPPMSDKEPASHLSGVENVISPQSAPVISPKITGLVSQQKETAIPDDKSKPMLPIVSSEKETVQEDNLIRKEGHAAVDPAEKNGKKNNTPEASAKRDSYAKLDKLPDLNDYPDIPEYKERPKKKQRLLLAAAFGAGNTQSNLSGENNQTVQRLPSRQLVKQKEVTANYSNILNANDYSNAQHYAPLSFGVRIEMPLTGWLSLESGLTYTYLKSILKGSGENDWGKLELHYLGIPLNVRAKIIDGAKWDLYGSVGGMGEKGVYAVYNQTVEDKSKTTNTRVEYTMEGLQWSLNGALGVEYKISKDLRFFIEPQITYYLENNQPISARTEQPLTLGLNGGLRIEL